MKLERLLRSPLINAVMILLIGITLLLMHYRIYLPDWILRVMAAVVLNLGLVWIVLVMVHNYQHPDRRIHLISYIPSEFREEDEGQQWINYRVTRRVYMMYCAAIPSVLVLIVLLPDGKAAAIVSLTVLCMLQQLMYWWELRKWEKV